MKEKFRQPEQAIRLFFWLFAAACLLAAIAMPDRGQMVEGMLRLCTLPEESLPWITASVAPCIGISIRRYLENAPAYHW